MHVFEKCAAFTAARELRAAGLIPYFQPITESRDTEVVIDGHTKVMVGSNNYMGLTHDPRILEAARDALLKYGSGNTGSRFLNGNLDLHDQLEAELADFTGKEAALVFSTGYQTNLGTIGALISRGDTVYLDKLDHACIQDGARLGFGTVERFRHEDYAHLERLLHGEDPERMTAPPAAPPLELDPPDPTEMGPRAHDRSPAEALGRQGHPLRRGQPGEVEPDHRRAGHGDRTGVVDVQARVAGRSRTRGDEVAAEEGLTDAARILHEALHPRPRDGRIRHPFVERAHQLRLGHGRQSGEVPRGHRLAPVQPGVEARVACRVIQEPIKSLATAALHTRPSFARGTKQVQCDPRLVQGCHDPAPPT